jgi:hypothetical protein
MARTTGQTRRKRLVWLLATKGAIALAIGLPTSFRSGAVEYRALAPLPGLEAGAPVTLAGQLIGKVVSMERRGDTTALRVWFVRGAERLPGSRAVRLRRLGFAGELVLEMGIGDRSRRPRHARSFALGGWLEVLPADSGAAPFIDDLTSRLPTMPPPLSPMPVYPPGRRALASAPLART